MGPLNTFSKGARAITIMSADVKSYKDFEQKFEDWIYSSKQIVSGLPEKSFLSSGITDAFNMLYGMYNVIGVFPGEYSYHRLVLPKNRVTYNLKKADVIIVSHPFSADGMSSEDRLSIADTYNKPIFVDCAYFGVCNNINFDLFLDFNLGDNFLYEGLLSFMVKNNYSCDEHGHPNIEGNYFIANHILNKIKDNEFNN